MKALLIGAAAAALTLGTAYAQSDTSGQQTQSAQSENAGQQNQNAEKGNVGEQTKNRGPGTTGAMENAEPNGVATNPEQVRQQEGSMAKHAPGTVGAAPGTDAPSQNPNGDKSNSESGNSK